MRIVFGKDKELEEAIKQGVMKEFENFLLRKVLEQAVEQGKRRRRQKGKRICSNCYTEMCSRPCGRSYDFCCTASQR